ncbi:phosphoribosyltransferase family protein [Gryllotalpicola ginsengisoli]|uniref:phosphoribosyltransferase family protein n=1 Tax=Gryllotalpicola ginsengisoli TaxID=444608 RepID=UPI0003B3AA97|nr:phosphoribosyltransferase family protein [Gryllotalpicola ginsengisoli]
MLFHDRDEAGERLADLLLNLAGDKPLVLAVSPGGAVVAAHVAARLGAPLGRVRGDRVTTDASAEASDRLIVLVDDAIETGEPLLAACRTVAALNPKRIVLAAPTAPPRWTPGRLAADLYCVARPVPAGPAERWYDEFPPVSERQARAALRGQDWAYAGATSL